MYISNLQQRLNRRHHQHQRYKLSLFFAIAIGLIGASFGYRQMLSQAASITSDQVPAHRQCAEHQVFRASDQKCYVMQGE
jgi:hypothetical protein